MSTGSKITLGIVLSLIIVLLFGGGTMWSHRQTAVALEQKIDAQYFANQSNYDNMWKKFKEMTQVTELQAEQFKDVYTGLISGRNQDQNLLFKMVQEQNPQLSQEVYTQLQREISAGRNTFDNNQKKVLDIVQQYNTYVNQHIFMAAVFGKTPKDMKEFIVTSERTDNAFNTKKDEVINLKGK